MGSNTCDQAMTKLYRFVNRLAQPPEEPVRSAKPPTRGAFVKRFILAAGLTAVQSLTAVAASSGANPFDGAWAEVIVGESKACDVTVNSSFTVTKGQLSQSNSSGTVNAGGSARGTVFAKGVNGTWTGHFSGNKASGRFQRSDGCVGRWSAVRQ